MHFRHFAWALPAVVCLTGTAFAQDKPKGNNTPSGKITVEKNTGSLEATARSRAAAGDCKGALDYYDAALTTSIEPELHRDRGICHEKLGHPYPAIDDYRFYLTNRPNATDAETIRERMDSLVEQTGQAPSDKSAAAAKSEEKKEEGDAKVTTSVGVGSGGVLVSLNPKANADDDPGANPEGGKSIDAIDKDEKLESEAEISPLRNGQGPMLGAFFTEHYWTKSNVGIGSLPATAAESVGGLFRYAFIPGHSFISEIGYVARNARQGSPAWGG
ncbi:MAG TPA: tetratricopeptide repeat protein, partial [Polyangiaceae bacterium]